MNYDVNNYRYAIEPQIRRWRERRPYEPIQQAATNISLSTNCPILVVCQLLQELEGPSEGLQNLIDHLKQFYK